MVNTKFSGDSYLILAFLTLTAATLIANAAFADELQTLVTTNGHRYEKARITEVTPISVTVVHSTGVSRVPLTEFPPDVQRRLGYDETKARGGRDATWQLGA